ncbi:tyrosine-type recombinase/integrase [Bacillus kwashiorkori]|uniref:tyrosine-type recombinase/integrase n=1 Tax=Bacillus kwashiorkori TaxID=1522318 RepID=UPI0007818504|nr:tyrosine-type recombinase/integrase [Bacillus kwashiorkori]
MKFVDPIRDIEKINAMREVLQNSSDRDLLLFVIGINTGIKINDLLYLTVKDVSDGKKAKEFIYLKESSTDQWKAYYLNNRVKLALKCYLANHCLLLDDYLFQSKKDKQPISRQQAYRIINHAAKEVGVPGNIGMHTLRKTFGYHAYKKGVAISIIMSIFNHHSPKETYRYLGIDKNEERFIKVDVNL